MAFSSRRERLYIYTYICVIILGSIIHTYVYRRNSFQTLKSVIWKSDGKTKHDRRTVSIETHSYFPKKTIDFYEITVIGQHFHHQLSISITVTSQKSHFQ